MHTEVKEAQYLYDSGDDVVFMDDETYEQFQLPHPFPGSGASSSAVDSVQILTVDGKPSAS